MFKDKNELNILHLPRILFFYLSNSKNTPVRLYSICISIVCTGIAYQPTMFEFNKYVYIPIAANPDDTAYCQPFNVYKQINIILSIT
jgi:hypothetical protein